MAANDAPPRFAFARTRVPSSDGDDDRRLTAGRNDADRCHRERHEHQDVGQRAEQADREDRPAVVGQCGAQPGAVAQRRRREDERTRHLRAPVVGDRRLGQCGDRVRVPEGVGSDRHPGEQREDDRRARRRTLAAEGERDHGADDERGADERDRPGPLAENHDREQHRQRRAGATGQGVDHRQVALGIAALQRREVGRVQAAAAGHERDARGADRLVADQQLQRGRGRVESSRRHSPASHTNGSPPRACLAKKFHAAWAIAAAAMRRRAVGLRGRFLSGAGRTGPQGFSPVRCGTPERPGAARSRASPPSLSLAIDVARAERNPRRNHVLAPP